MPLPIAPWFIDTSILIRLDQPGSPVRPAVIATLKALGTVTDPLHIAPQNLIEFWGVATRPVANNGLGLTPAAAALRVRALQRQFVLLPDTAAVYPAWEHLAEVSQVSGRQVHDTRLVAIMMVNQITNLLTLNAADFRRFEPSITVVEPSI